MNELCIGVGWFWHFFFTLQSSWFLADYLPTILILSSPLKTIWRDSIESLTERWVSDGSMKCLSAVSNRDDVSANVIVTNSQLIAALVKLLLNGLAKFFPVQNVYSSSKVGKVGGVLIFGILTDCTCGRFFKGCNCIARYRLIDWFGFVHNFSTRKIRDV